MYKIIGADGKEYGPVSVDQLKLWIAEGRLNLQSKVLPDGATEWKTVGEIPELATAVPKPAAPISGTYAPVSTASAADQVSGPAIGLMIVAGLALALVALNLILMAAGVVLFPVANQGQSPEFVRMMQGIGGVIGAVVGFGIYGTVFFGALKMKKLKSRGLAIAASILAMLPCSFCCLAGLPIGIWSLVVLSKPEVKAAFD